MSFFLVIPLIPLAVLGPILLGLLIKALSAKDATSIAIFGSKAAGKTTLWQQLKGEFENRKYIPTIEKVAINEFTIEYNGKKKTIKETADLGGGDEFVKRYGEIIENGTFVYYLIDLTTLNEKKDETRARLQAICKYVSERKLEFGLQVIGTNYREYQKTTGLSKEDAKKQLMDCLDLGSIKGVKINDIILIAELTDRNDIMQIVKQIIE